MKNRNKIAISLVALITIISSYALLPKLSPLSPAGIFTNLNKRSNDYIIIGFLPFWNYEKLNSLSETTVTHIAYFSLRLNGDGSIQKLTTPVSEEPGFTNFKKITQSPPSKPLILTISQADNNEIDQLLSSSYNIRSAVKTITDLSLSYNISGINIDIEPTGNISQTKRASFTEFIKELKTSLKPNVLLSVDVYPTAASTNRLWDIKELNPYIDHIVVMTYDYYQQNALSSGPNSPLRGAPNIFEEDIIKNISEINSLIPSTKILLGIPFYGYEWTTTSTDKYSPTKSGSIASLERISQIISNGNSTIYWDRNSLTPYIVHTENGITKQIYFDNADSIKLKLDLVKQANLGGIAIWALGYEGFNPTIWSTIQTLTQ